MQGWRLIIQSYGLLGTALDYAILRAQLTRWSRWWTRLRTLSGIRKRFASAFVTRFRVTPVHDSWLALKDAADGAVAE